MNASLYRQCHRYRLSAAETEITQAIVEGQDLNAIAALRRTSILTVRSQVKSIFRKTGARSQAQLVALFFRPA